MPSAASYPAALYLDLDDTLIVYSASPKTAWKGACQEQAGRGAISTEALLTATEQTSTWYWSDPQRSVLGRRDLLAATMVITEKALSALGVPDAAASQQLARSYRTRRDGSLQPAPGALETLQQLRGVIAQLALLTNGDGAGQREKVRRFKLAPFFDHILIEGELGFGKPDRRVFERALHLTRTKPHETWMVGDNLHGDIGGAKACGLVGVWLDASGTGRAEASTLSQLDLTNTALAREVHPDRTIRTLAELLA